MGVAVEESQTLLIIFCDSAAAEEVKEALRRLGHGYARWGPVLGEGRTGRKENDPVFPGANTAFCCLLPEEEVLRATGELEQIKAGFRLTPGLSVFALPARRLM